MRPFLPPDASERTHLSADPLDRQRKIPARLLRRYGVRRNPGQQSLQCLSGPNAPQQGHARAARRLRAPSAPRPPIGSHPALSPPVPPSRSATLRGRARASAMAWSRVRSLGAAGTDEGVANGTIGFARFVGSGSLHATRTSSRRVATISDRARAARMSPNIRATTLRRRVDASATRAINAPRPLGETSTHSSRES